MQNNWKIQFFTLWLGQAVSVLSSAVLQMALIWQLSLQTGSAAVLSIASLAGFLPMAVLGIFAGTLVDRWNRKATLILADLFIAAVSLALAIYSLYASPPVWLILTVLFVRSIGAAFHSPAIGAVTPLIVPESMLTKCAGYTQSLMSIGYMAGTALAALLYPIWHMSGLVLLDVAGAVLASISVAFIAIPTVPKQDDTSTRTPILAEMHEGYRAIRENRGLFALLWIGAAVMFIYFPVNALFPLLTFGHFNGDTTMASISEITFSVGMLLGGMLLGVWGGFKNRGHSIVLAIVMLGLSIGITGILPQNGFWGFAALCVVMGLAVPFYSGPQDALIQEQIAPQYLGRVFGLFGSVMSLAMPFGLVLSGLFADRIGINNWFTLSGVASLLLAALTYSLKAIRDIEQPGASGE